MTSRDQEVRTVDADISFAPSATEVAGSRMTAFIRHCERATGRQFDSSESFYRFSVDEFRTFWQLFLRWSRLRVEGSDKIVCRGDDVEQAEFFPGVRLNYVENLLQVVPERESATALVARHSAADTTRLSRRELRDQVVRVASSLEELGVRPGQRIVAVSTNTEHLVVAALAVMALGATLSTVAPDMGTAGILARFDQLAPSWMLYGADGSHTLSPSREEHLEELVTRLPTLEGVVILDGPPRRGSLPVSTFTLDDLRRGECPHWGADFSWRRFPFNHPLNILFSSGTTGAPKCIIHGAGGTVLEHAKEHLLHGDLGATDVMFFQTTPAWMMWNWQLSALLTGSTVVLYDGPVSGPDSLWSIVDEERVTAFGSGPRFLKYCQDAGYEPNQRHDLVELRRLFSTGAVLYSEQFDWARAQVGRIPVHSISGGTDIVGCFLLGNPNLPVRRGELQCRSLGLDVRSFPHPDGSLVGELTCWNPFPSRPLGFFGDHGGVAFHRAYFEETSGAWTHGDRVEITADGSARIYGRSDGVMNINGVRVGPAEIYALLETMPELNRTMAVEQQRCSDAAPSRIVLLAVMSEGVELDGELANRIRRTIAQGATTSHVPAVIVAVPDLPRTYSGKDSERAARDVVNGVPLVNAQALLNPECLDAIESAVLLADSRREAEHARQSREEALGLRLDHRPNQMATLQSLFARVLNLPVVGPDDNFFELGGTSLSVAYLAASIQEALGVEVPLSAVFAGPSARHIAHLISGDATELPSTLVCLRHGDPAARPIFIFFDITGDVMAYHHVVRALPGDRPIFGIRARGVDGRSRMDSSVADMAESAIDDMRQIQAGGSYTLLGYSFGGMIAFETARRLEAAGSGVDCLVLLDSYLGLGALTWVQRSKFKILGRPLQIVSRIRRENWRGLLARGVRLLLNQPGLQTVQPRTALQQAFRQHAHQELLRYRPGPFGGSLVFVRCSIRLTFRPDPVMAWRRAVGPNRFVLVPFEGDHFSPKYSTRADEVARLVTRVLDSVK